MKNIIEVERGWFERLLELLATLKNEQDPIRIKTITAQILGYIESAEFILRK